MSESSYSENSEEEVDYGEGEEEEEGAEVEEEGEEEVDYGDGEEEEEEEEGEEEVEEEGEEEVEEMEEGAEGKDSEPEERGRRVKIRNVGIRHGDDRPPKQMRDYADRISQLPDSIITHILSLMPTKDAVRTSALSRRWQHTWTLTSALIYNFDGGSAKNFVKFVDTTLILHRSSKIRKFVLESFSTNFRDACVSLWVHAAVVKEVEELSVKFRCDYIDPLPKSLYSCESLTQLSLSACRISLKGSTINWRSLKHLSLECAKLQDEEIQKLLAGSPVLESLKLKGCKEFGHVDIKSKNVKRLIIHGYMGSDDGWLEISSPSLESLEILGDMVNKKCRLKNVSSLLHANLTFHMIAWGYFPEEENDNYDIEIQNQKIMVKDLMAKVHRVQNLIIGNWVVQVLSLCELTDLSYFTSFCKCLKLEIGLHEYDLPGVESLLKASPFLRRLVLDMSVPYNHYQFSYGGEFDSFSGKNHWRAKNRISQCLRVVEIVGFSKHAVEFAQFVLRNAKALEKVIFCRSKGCSDDWKMFFGRVAFFEVIQKLLSFPRASPRAQILLL